MEVDHRSTLLLSGWIAVNLAITINEGDYQPTALGLVVVGLGLACSAVVWLRRERGSGPLHDLPSSATAAAGACLAASTMMNVAFYADDAGYALNRDLGVLAAGLALAVALAPAGYRRVLALTSAASAAASLVMIIIVDSKPHIDVWFILTVGSRRMFSGHNIFTSCWPGNADRLTDCVYPYLPVTTVVQTPFRILLGDIRYSYVGALLLSAVILWRLGGHLWGPVLAALLLVSPSLSHLVELAWTEPLLLLGLGVMVLATLRGRMVMAILGFGFALACKQHVLLLIPLAAWWPAFGWRRTVTSVTGSVLVTLPWFIVDPTAFLDDALRFNLHLRPRADSLSIFTTAMNAGWKPPFVLVGALTIAAIGGVMTYVPRTASGFVLGSALVLFAFNLLNKQSFFNQWWLVGALLLLALATAVAEHEAVAQQETPDIPSLSERR
jgi:hypothetical protein